MGGMGGVGGWMVDGGWMGGVGGWMQNVCMYVCING